MFGNNSRKKLAHWIKLFVSICGLQFLGAYICALEVTKVSLLMCCPPILPPRSHQSITIHFVHSARTVEVTKVSSIHRFFYPTYQSVTTFVFSPLSCAFDVNKVLLFVFSTRLAFSKLPIRRCFCVPLRLASSKLPECHYLLLFVSLLSQSVKS